jgi:hypothetical protein
MNLRLVRDFGTGDIETARLSPAVLAVEVAPENSEEVEAILLVHSVRGRFTCTAEPSGGRFLVAIGDSSDLDSIREALEAAGGIECGGPSGCRCDPYASAPHEAVRGGVTLETIAIASRLKVLFDGEFCLHEAE